MHQGSARPRLSILVPAFNEERNLAKTAGRLLGADFGMSFEVIIIDDGSTDGTLRVAEEIARGNPAARLVRNQKNLGKGASLRKAAAIADGELLAIQDADLEYDPAEIPRLLGPLLEGRCDAVYGSRFLARAEGMSRLHMFGNRFLTSAANLMFGGRLTDMETCYKLMRKSVWDSLTLTKDRFEIEGEITGELLRHGLRICELPISYRARGYGQGKKINVADGLKTFATLVECRLRR